VEVRPPQALPESPGEFVEVLTDSLARILSEPGPPADLDV
jgi:hypothetical protein